MTQQDRRNFLKTGLMVGAGTVLSSIPGNGFQKKSDTGKDLSAFDAIHSRRSVRSFLPTPIPEEHITKICDAARMAPTSGNQQPWKFLVVKKRAKIDELINACSTANLNAFKARRNPSDEEQKKFEERTKDYFGKLSPAPVFIVVLVDMQSKYPTYNRFDGPLAAGYLMLAARALGYGTVFFTDSIPDKITKQVFNIPDRYQRVCVTPIGVPTEWPSTPAKKKLDEFMIFDSF